MIKGADIHLHDLVAAPLVLLVTEVTVDVSRDTPVVAFAAADPLIDLAVAAPTLAWLGDVDVITMALSTLIRAVEVGVDLRERVSRIEG
jgi:hypothetical protein